jgi:hypothetical protein
MQRTILKIHFYKKTDSYEFFRRRFQDADFHFLVSVENSSSDDADFHNLVSDENSSSEDADFHNLVSDENSSSEDANFHDLVSDENSSSAPQKILFAQNSPSFGLFQMNKVTGEAVDFVPITVTGVSQTGMDSRWCIFALHLYPLHKISAYVVQICTT